MILEFHETSKVAMIVQPKTLVVCFGLWHKVVVYVKDGCINLNTLTNVLTNIVSCISLMFSPLILVIIMSILCLNVVNMLSVNDLEVCDSMIEVSIKHACTHGFLLKIATCKKIVHGKNYFMQKKKTRWS
jgi:hypothetical protein